MCERLQMGPAVTRSLSNDGHSATRSTGPSDNAEGGSWRAAENFLELFSPLSVAAWDVRGKAGSLRAHLSLASVSLCVFQNCCQSPASSIRELPGGESVRAAENPNRTGSRPSPHDHSADIYCGPARGPRDRGRAGRAAGVRPVPSSEAPSVVSSAPHTLRGERGGM